MHERSATKDKKSVSVVIRRRRAIVPGHPLIVIQSGIKALRLDPLRFLSLILLSQFQSKFQKTWVLPERRK